MTGQDKPLGLSGAFGATSLEAPLHSPEDRVVFLEDRERAHETLVRPRMRIPAPDAAIKLVLLRHRP